MSRDGIALLDTLSSGFRNVGEVLDRSHSTLAADPVLSDLATVIEGVSDATVVKAAVVRLFDMKGEPLAVEAMQYLAHRFRWPWLKEELEARRLATSDLRLSRFYELVLEAFSEDWEDREFFPSLARF